MAVRPRQETEHHGGKSYELGASDMKETSWCLDAGGSDEKWRLSHHEREASVSLEMVRHPKFG